MEMIWIDINDQLPPQNIFVIVSTIHGTVGTLSLGRCDEDVDPGMKIWYHQDDDWDCVPFSDVTHWMFFPAAAQTQVVVQ